jgi:5S rRNA maturation endonuclease (ribonuclease M5)
MRDDLIKKINGTVKNNWIIGFCPWHENDGKKHNPSLWVKEDLSFFKCGSRECAKGPINILLKKLEMQEIVSYQDCIDRKTLQFYRERFLEDKPDIKTLQWSLDVCNTFNIGWSKKSFVIPVSHNGVVVQVWYYTPNETQANKYKGKVINAPVALFPDINLLKGCEGEDLYLCEGYGDTLALLSAGYCAVTGGGKTQWKEEHIGMLAQYYWNHIYIVPDTDETGRVLGRRLRHWLNKRNLKFTWLTFSQKDVTKNFQEGGKREDWYEHQEQIAEGHQTDFEAEEIRLSNLHTSEPNKLLRVKAVVSGKYDSPYRVPSSFRVQCEESSGKICPACQYGAGTEVELSTENKISFVGTTIEKLDSRIKKTLDRPAKCPGCRIEIDEESLQYIEEVRIRLPHEEVGLEEANIDRRLFFCGVGLIVNDVYEFTGYILSHPETQEIAFVATSAEHLNVEVGADLKCPQIEYKSVSELINDISFNITNIYAREQLHFFTLMALFSPMSCVFQGVQKRLYSEVLILGDSECGKSAVMKALFKFFGVGTVVDASQTTSAGILGGINETDKGRRFINPGILVSYDRKIIGIEEMGNLHPDIIRAMRETRSSGVVSIGKIEKAQYSARTRIIATGNPKSGRRTIRSFNYGIEAVFSVFSDPADIRRFTAIHIIQDDLDPQARYKQNQKQTEHIYTKDIAQQHLTWCWSLKENEIEFTSEAENLLHGYAVSLGIKGHTSLPLLTKTNAIDKLCQMSVSVACILGSTADGRKLLVLPEHVDEACQRIIQEYSNLPSGYFDYCEERYREDVIAVPEDVLRGFTALINPRQMALMLKSGSVWQSLYDLESHCLLGNNNRDMVKSFLHTLMRNNCLKKAGSTIYKTPAFQEWLSENAGYLKDISNGPEEV